MRIAGVVLGAGAGTRLRPMTDTLAKPLLPVLDRPIVGYTLDHLVASGVQEIFVNLHHHAEQVRRALAVLGCPVPVTGRVEPRLSGPAGALRLFDRELARYDAVLVASGDVLVEHGFDGLLARHLGSGAPLTVAVTRRRRASRFGVLDLDGDGLVRGAREKPPVPDAEVHWVSAGVYCLTPELIRAFPEGVSYDYAAQLIPDLLSSGSPVASWAVPGYWRDIGTAQSLRQANLDAVRGGVHIGAGARIGEDVQLRGPLVVGAGAEVGDGAWLEDTVVLPGAVVPPGSVLIGALVGPAGDWTRQHGGCGREVAHAPE
ncbi:sugar phosphate nucleotidyltransferase [Kitasatospora azatica]|uniref:sugar phosphate nucleotidyltransferase n=1 Tax=Kitasatospora azatica TaxID=58347 RepID=UPI0005698E35|nr:NDP-sugar synthase [Kitasatospora azatica]